MDVVVASRSDRYAYSRMLVRAAGEVDDVTCVVALIVVFDINVFDYGVRWRGIGVNKEVVSVASILKEEVYLVSAATVETGRASILVDWCVGVTRLEAGVSK
nr:hypothetical protein Iba_chr10dCG10030 [Ipomoea batatas]